MTWERKGKETMPVNVRATYWETGVLGLTLAPNKPVTSDKLLKFLDFSALCLVFVHRSSNGLQQANSISNHACRCFVLPCSKKNSNKKKTLQKQI